MMEECEQGDELVFHNRPLTEVIEELQRYHPSRVRLIGDRLG